MDEQHEIAAFRRRLAETIAWCAGRAPVADPKNSLRTPVLRPAALDDTRGWYRYRWDAIPERQVIVSALADERARFLHAENGYSECLVEGLAGGRLLLYDPDANLCDGAAEEESCGFFDVDNTPPWDTWIAYICERERGSGRWTPFGSFLVSWVPPEFINVVAGGIWINPEECIVWAADHDSAFTHALRTEGILG